jgi:uncharacterized phage-associated protein
MFKELFNEKKAAQVAAFFLIRAKAQLPVLKLTKLMYLAERRSFELYGDGITGDRMVSMTHGPVLSYTYSHMNGALDSSPEGWETWVADREEHNLSLTQGKLQATAEDLLELSDADVAVLEEVWNKFGHMNKYQVRDYTHNGGCPEWQDPDGSSITIKPEELFKALNFSSEQSSAYIARMKQQAAINAAHNNLAH